MRFKQLSAILFAVLIFIGVILRMYAYKTGCIMLFIGTLYLLLYYLVKTFIEIKNKSNHILILIFQLIVALMSVVICGKYIYFSSGYVLGLVVVPAFLVTIISYWVKIKNKAIDLTILSIIYSLLCIPMFANFYDYPFDTYYKRFYPQQYIKYNEIGIDASFDFHIFRTYNQNNKPNEETTALALRAHELSVEEGRYEEAIEIYRQYLTMEETPHAHMYYKLADCYIRTDQYDLALNALDSTIILDPEKAEYYSTRGWLYSKRNEEKLALRDLTKSIELDSTDAGTYLTLALTYYFLSNDPSKAYEAFKKAEFYDYEFAKQYSSLLQEIEEKLAQE